MVPRFAQIIPAGQAAPTPLPAGSCPHCPSLPSSETAYELVSGKPGAFLKVARDLFLRGVLVWTGIAAYDAIAGREDPVRLQRAIAGAAGIEVFVLAWTWWKKPTTPGGLAPAGRAIDFRTSRAIR